MTATATVADVAAELRHDIAYIVPSRTRPHNIVDLAAAWLETSAGYAALVVAVDDDDPALEDYLEVAEQLAGHDATRYWFRMVVGERRRLGGTLNRLAPVFAVDRLAVGFMGDDHRPRTEAWDASVAAAIAGRLGVVAYCDDLVQRHNLPTAVALDARIVRALGFMVPPGMVHLYLDDYWRELGIRLDSLRYLGPDVVIEHLHPTAGTAEHDALYAEVNRAELYTADRNRLAAYRDTRFNDDIATIRQELNR